MRKVEVKAEDTPSVVMWTIISQLSEMILGKNPMI